MRSIPRSLKVLTPVVFAATASFGMIACVPEANPSSCNGAIGAKTVEKVHVPSGATCNLDGTIVKGNITIARNGTLKAHKVRVGGNVQSQGHKLAILRTSSVVGGSVQLENGGEVQVADSRIDGSIQLKANRARAAAARNTVGSDVQLFDNRGALANQNRIKGNLQCKGNNPAPTGSGNIVQGNKEDQCRRM